MHIFFICSKRFALNLQTNGSRQFESWLQKSKQYCWQDCLYINIYIYSRDCTYNWLTVQWMGQKRRGSQTDGLASADARGSRSKCVCEYTGREGVGGAQYRADCPTGHTCRGPAVAGAGVWHEDRVKEGRERERDAAKGWESVAAVTGAMTRRLCSVSLKHAGSCPTPRGGGGGGSARRLTTITRWASSPSLQTG